MGAAFARAITTTFDDLDEIWLIARRRERLEQFAAAHPASRFRILAMDLTDDLAYTGFENTLWETQPEILILINNAGYQSAGRFEETPPDGIDRMIDVNVLAATRIQRICDPYLGKDSISILTSSVLAYVPTPGQAVYSATKAYLYSFGRALREEYRDRKGNVLVLCPGSMDTEMNPKESNPHSIYCDVDRIAENALRKAERGASAYTPGFLYKIYRVISKIIPHTVLIRIVSRMYRR